MSPKLQLQNLHVWEQKRSHGGVLEGGIFVEPLRLPQKPLWNTCRFTCIIPLISAILVAILIYTSVTCAIGPSVTMFSTDFSFQNLVFWNLFEFSVAEIT
jgi:hypothetical protein